MALTLLAEPYKPSVECRIIVEKPEGLAPGRYKSKIERECHLSMALPKSRPEEKVRIASRPGFVRKSGYTDPI